jgi:predicted nucleic acid-binding protein
MSVTVDASVWVAARFAGEPGSAESVACLRTVLATGEAVVQPWLTWVEVVAAITRKTGRAELALEVGRYLRGLDAIRWVDLDAAGAAEASSLAASWQLRAADAVYAAVAGGHRATLVTLDLELQARCGAEVPCQSPGDWNAHHAAGARPSG